jgi:hypothetical protein
VYTWPFGTPTGALAAIWVISFIVLVAAPAGDAFNFCGFVCLVCTAVVHIGDIGKRIGQTC